MSEIGDPPKLGGALVGTVVPPVLRRPFIDLMCESDKEGESHALH